MMVVFSLDPLNEALFASLLDRALSLICEALICDVMIFGTIAVII